MFMEILELTKEQLFSPIIEKTKLLFYVFISDNLNFMIRDYYTTGTALDNYSITYQLKIFIQSI